MKYIRWSFFLILFLVLSVSGYSYWRYQRYFPSSTEAYVNAHLLPIATQVKGTIKSVYIQSHQVVKQDELLFELEAEPFQLALQTLKTRLALAKTAASDNPTKKLVAELTLLEAEVAKAKLKLELTQIFAPVDGIVTEVTLYKGMVVNASEPLLTIVDVKKWWVEANYAETDFRRIHPNQTAKITVDMYPGHTFEGVVTSLSPTSSAVNTLLNSENTANKPSRTSPKFPVRLHITNPDPRYPLHVGASSHVVIDTTISQEEDEPKSWWQMLIE